MAILQWFDASQAIHFAKEISEEFARQFPPKGLTLEERLTRSKDRKKFEKVLKQIFLYAESNPMNFYVKARFLKALMANLEAQGQDSATVNKLIEALATKL
ncbi:hypothetical protein [Thiolapillus brandeum]|uniref:hypothetical protein n=1 Tax=Thiolapillus brandeum TaxID=1076588 RepID=UPI000596DD0F|nr:hypothetical protein [Thiolapillus brandeum]